MLFLWKILLQDDATARLEAHQENQEEGIQVPEETNSDGINPAAELQGTDGDGLAKLDAGSEQDEKSVEEKIDAVASAIQANENGSQVISTPTFTPSMTRILTWDTFKGWKLGLTLQYKDNSKYRLFQRRILHSFEVNLFF